MGNPVIIAAELRSIASKLDKSKKPSLSAVRDDLKKVLAAVQGESRESRCRRIAQDIRKLAQEEVEASSWNGDGTPHVATKDEVEKALGLMKGRINSFLNEIEKPSK